MPQEKPLNPRLSVTFSAEAMDWLEAEAGRRAQSLAELLRRIVDEARGSYIVPRSSRGPN